MTGHKPEGLAANGFIHMINSGSAALDGTGQQTKDGKPAIKPFWEITEEEAQNVWRLLPGDQLQQDISAGRVLERFLNKRKYGCNSSSSQPCERIRTCLQIAEGYTVEIPEEVHDVLDGRTDPTWPTTWFVPNLTGEGAFQDVYTVMNNWGANHV